MGSNKSYWGNREARKRNAVTWLHKLHTDSVLINNVAHSITRTILFRQTDPLYEINSKEYCTELRIVDMTTVQAIFQYADNDSTIAALNFASYKNPGGKFLEGSSAQEEMLCHTSTLYPVLAHFDQFYKDNKTQLNRGLYQSNILYSPDICFIWNMLGKYICKRCDIITCAAPNWSAAKRNNVCESELILALNDRIQRIFNIAMAQNVNTLILGAFGCGVFENNPHTVASIFRNLLNTEYNGVFRSVIFAIPCDTGKNAYNNFKIFCDELIV